MSAGSFKFEATSKYWISGYKWCPTSANDIEKTEDQILSYIKCKPERFFVNVGPNINIWTLASYPEKEDHIKKYIQKPTLSKSAAIFETLNNSSPIITGQYSKASHHKESNNNVLSMIDGENDVLNKSSDTIDNFPLILIHGFCAGIAFWLKNLDALAPYRRVFAFDLLGFGRSSRIQFSNCPIKAENQFVMSIEKWRQKLRIEKMILMGHSFGGYLATAYALKYPNAVKHLILCDPWGFPEKSSDTIRPIQSNIPLWIKFAASVFQPFNPLAFVRLAGPWGPSIVDKFRPDLPRKFTDILGENSYLFSQYVYHCNAQTPSGEAAFTTMTIPFGWAKNPMIKRVAELDKNVPMTIIYGSRSWMDSSVGFQVKYLRPESYVDVKILTGAGHHVYADKATEFNHIINSICQKIDENRLRIKK